MSFAPGKLVDPAKVFMTSSSRLEDRWDPNYYRCMADFRKRLKKCAFPIERLKRSLAYAQYGISERATDEPVGVPMLRMINLQDDTWDLSDLKYIRMTDAEKKPYLLEQGDILFNRTNSKELIGKCGVFNLSGEYVFASYLIRVRLKNDTLLPDYVTAFLSSGLGRIQIDAVSRQIAGMTNINAEEIRRLLIPSLDKDTQENVVRVWQAAILDRDKTLDRAREILLQIDDVLLDELGILRKPEPPNTLKSRVFKSALSVLTGQRLDPFRYSRRQVERRNLVKNNATNYRKLKHCVLNVVGGDWGQDDADSYDEKTLQRCLVIRNTEFDNSFNLKIESGREKYRLINRSKLRTLKIRALDLLVEKSGGSIDQPVGRVAILQPDHLALGSLGYSNFLVKMRANTDIVNPHFLYYWLRTAHRIGITESMQAQTNGLRNLIVDEYLDQEIPIPTQKKTQERIVLKLERISEHARSLREQARADLEKAKLEIEALILGKALAK